MPTTIVLIWTIVVYSAMNNKFAFILILTWQSCHSYGNIVWRSDAQKHDGILMTLHENMRRLLLLLVIVDITAAELLCSLWLFIWSSWNDVRCGKIVNSLYIFQLKYFHDPVVSCLQRLDNLDQMETSQQRAEVYTNLIQVIPDIHKVRFRYTLFYWQSLCHTEPLNWVHCIPE